MNKLGFVILSISTVFFITAQAGATVINILQPSPTAGLWSNAYPASPGSVSIVDVTGQGGNLESGSPLGNGVLRLETTNDVSSRAEAKITDNYGQVGDFITGGSLSYDYYQQSGGDSATIAPAVKLEVIDYTDISGDGYATFIFEPYYNGGVGAFDTWHNVSIDGDTGNFWHTGIYGVGAATVFDMTFGEWLTSFGSTFSDAFIFSISLGLGSGTPNQIGYVDNVNYANGASTMSADFETLEIAVVPLPAALPLYGTGIVLMGLVGWKRRRKQKV